jgi:subtilase family serine protease
MKLRIIILFITIVCLSFTEKAKAWSGDPWGPISRDDISALACQMMYSIWTPLNDITNHIDLKRSNIFYAGTSYMGIAYSQGFPEENWTEFLDLVDTTIGGDTYYGNDCYGFVSISWKLPHIFSTAGFEKNLGGDYFYALGEANESSYVSLLPGDALNSSYHVMLFAQYNQDGTIQSMEQAPPEARQRIWSWSSLSNFRPIRRELLEGGIGVDDRVQTSYDVGVMSCPGISCPLIWTAPMAAQGIIVDGPQYADKYRWWKVQYDDYGTAGWTNEGFLRKMKPQTLSCDTGSDVTPPEGSVEINLGADYTSVRAVILNLSCIDDDSGCAWMRFSNDGAVWTPWEVYDTSKNWVLPSGDGEKIVYVQFKDPCENMSLIYSKPIILQSLIPDFTISSLTVPASAGAGTAIDITDTTSNNGQGGANASMTSFFLSASYGLHSSDIKIGSRFVPSLDPGESSTGTISVVIPSDLSPGTYYIYARANSEAPVDDCVYIIPCGSLVETSRTNNAKYRSINIGAEGATSDLVISTVTVPSTGVPGLTITIGDTTKNQGTGTAGPSTTNFYWSTNSTYSADDIYLGSRSIPSLGPSATNTGAINVTVPASECSGTFYIIARADGDNVIPETNENNNNKSKYIKTGPDLVVSAITVPSTSGGGKTIMVTDTTANNGGCTAGTSNTKFYLSTNSAWDAGDTYLGVRVIPALAAGATSTGDAFVTIPSGTPAGTYYIIARADADGIITETKENNNNKSKSVKIGPDLVISSISAPASSEAGATITVTDTTKNVGGMSAGESTTIIYLSTDSTYDAGDTYLGSRFIPSLENGAASAGSTSATIPGGTAAGTYYIIARADADGIIAETSETNNNKSKSIKIGPDLKVSAIAAPTSTAIGSAISVTDTTKNCGGGEGGASTTKLYLSTNTTYEAGDTYVGQRAVPALAAGASNAGSTPITIPGAISAGSYYIIAVSDVNNAVVETIETNNTKYKAINIFPGE